MFQSTSMALLRAALPLIAMAATASSVHAEPTPEMGKTIFTETAEPQCGICHSLKDAGAAGQVGPSLDEMKPTADRVEAAVTNGLGVMPAYETLTEEQIRAVALYVARAAGKE
jgi:mono/diheme cytochrome c family protein